MTGAHWFCYTLKYKPCCQFLADKLIITAISIRAIHKGRPQNFAIFYFPSPTSEKFGLLQAKLTQAYAFAKLPLPLMRMSFMDDPSEK